MKITSESGCAHLSVVAEVVRHGPTTRHARWRLLRLRSFNRRGPGLLNFLYPTGQKKAEGDEHKSGKKDVRKRVVALMKELKRNKVNERGSRSGKIFFIHTRQWEHLGWQLFCLPSSWAFFQSFKIQALQV